MVLEVFLENAYAKSIAARVTAVSGETRIECDKTVLYPQGGGQPFDQGKIVLESGESFDITRVARENGTVLHEVDRAGLSTRDSVQLHVDWNRRYRLMRMHTSAHLLAHVLHAKTGALITGNQLDLDESRMDFSAAEFDRELLSGFESDVNALIERDLAVSVSFEPYERAIARPELFRLKNVLPKNLPQLRIVSIGDVDIQADGGTHVARTREIGAIEITSLKNKGAQNRRIYWKLK